MAIFTTDEMQEMFRRLSKGLLSPSLFEQSAKFTRMFNAHRHAGETDEALRARTQPSDSGVPDVKVCPSCGQRVFEIEGQLVEHDTQGGLACGLSSALGRQVADEHAREEKFLNSARSQIVKRLLTVK